MPERVIDTYIKDEIERLKKDIGKTDIPRQDREQFEKELAVYEFLKKRFIDGH